MRLSLTGRLSDTPVPEIYAVDLASEQPGMLFVLTPAPVLEQSLALQLRCFHLLLHEHRT